MKSKEQKIVESFMLENAARGQVANNRLQRSKNKSEKQYWSNVLTMQMQNVKLLNELKISFYEAGLWEK